MPEGGSYFRPAGLPGIEALHTTFVGLAFRTAHRDADAILRGLKRQP